MKLCVIVVLLIVHLILPNGANSHGTESHNQAKSVPIELQKKKSPFKNLFKRNRDQSDSTLVADQITDDAEIEDSGN